MTAPEQEPLLVPAGQARQILDLLTITGSLLSALRARGQRGDASTLASLEDLAVLLTGGGDASTLITRLDTAQRDLAGRMLAREAP
jgi:hypothetical protein